MFPPCLFCLACAVLPSAAAAASSGSSSSSPAHTPTHADTTSLLVLGNKDLRAQAALLADGHTVVVVVSAPPPGELTASAPYGTRTSSRALPNGGCYEVTLRFVSTLREVSIERRASMTVLEVVVEGPTDSLRSRILSPLPRSVPSAFLAPHLRRSEAALSSLDLIEARAQYTALAGEYALRAWVEIRLADIDVLDNEIGSACGRYRKAASSFNDRSAGLVALLRLRALGCPGTSELELTSILSTIARVEGAVGGYLRRELVWTLAREREGRDPSHVFKTLCEPAARRSLGTPVGICDGLLAYILRAPKAPYETILGFLRHQDDVARHPEANALRLAWAQALIELDLPAQAVPILEGVLHSNNNGALWRERQGAAQAASLLVSAYDQSGHSYLGHQLAKRFGFNSAPVAAASSLSVVPLGATLQDVWARLDALRAFMSGALTATQANSKQLAEEHHEDRTL